MHHIINYLENQGFIRTQNIESLKITLKEEGDLRYFWDENSLGLHIKKDFWDGDPLFYQKMGLTLLKEVAPKLKILYLARNGFMDLEINNYPNLEYLNVSENKRITSLSLQNMPKQIGRASCRERV